MSLLKLANLKSAGGLAGQRPREELTQQFRCTGHLPQNSLLLKRGQSFVLFRTSPDWIRPTHALESNLLYSKFQFKCSVQFSSVAQSCPTLCDPMNRSTPGLPVHHQLPEFTQSHPWSQWCYSHPKTLIDISRKNIYPQIGTLWSSQADI